MVKSSKLRIGLVGLVALLFMGGFAAAQLLIFKSCASGVDFEQDRADREAMREGWAVGAAERVEEVAALWLDPTAAVVVENDRAYVAAGSQGLLIIDLNTRPKLRILERIATKNAQDLAVNERYVYVADDMGGLLIVDVGDHKTPRQVGHLDTPGEAKQLAFSEQRVFVADGSALRIVSVKQPYSPQEVGVVKRPIHDVAVAEHAICLAAAQDGLVLLSREEPNRVLSTTAVEGGASRIAVAGNRLVLGAGGKLHVYDIKDPTEPQLVARGSISRQEVHHSVGRVDGLSFSGADILVAGGQAGCFAYSLTKTNKLQRVWQETRTRAGCTGIVASKGLLTIASAMGVIVVEPSRAGPWRPVSTM